MQPVFTIEDFNSFFDEFDYPLQARRSVLNNYGKIILSDQLVNFNELICQYDKSIKCDFENMFKKIKEIAESLAIHEYAGVLILLISLSKVLKKYYLQEKITLDVYKDSLMDVKYKMNESYNMYNVWGVSSKWFAGFYQLKRFGFGKLEFGIDKFFHNFTIDGIVLTPESDVVYVHIPNTGSHLSREDVEYSFSRAKEFYKNQFNQEKVVFACRTWLLFRKHKEILKPESNLVQFINYFTIIEEGFYPDYNETWRLFGRKDLSDYDKLPQKTSLQKAYVEMMKKGEKTGWSFGVLVR